MLDKIPPEVREIAPGAIGSAVALRWVDGPWYWRLVIFIAGATAAYLASAPTAELMGLHAHWIGVLGLVIGMLSMSVATKVIELVQLLDVRQLAQPIIDWLKRRLG